METIIKNKDDFRLKLKKNPCLKPVGIFHLEITGEQIKDGEVIQSSTYQFFMTEDEINILAKALTK